MKLTRYITLAILILVLAWNMGCSSRRSKPEASASGFMYEENAQAASPQEQKEYESIETAYHQKNFEILLKRSKTFLSKYPKSPIIDQVHNFRGLTYVGLKQYQHALINFKKVVSTTQSEVLRNMALYNEAYVEYELNQLNDANETLEKIRINALENTDRSKFFILQAKVAKERHDSHSSVRAILSAIKYAPSTQTSGDSTLLKFLDESLDSVDNISVVEKLIQDYEDSSALDRLYYRAAVLASNSGDSARAKVYYGKIAENFPESKYLSVAKDNYKEVTTNSRVDAKKIGVLLTLSGKFGKFGYKALQGIELASKIFQPQNPGHKIQLVVMDDHGDTDTALKALDELYYKHNVVAVIGPLVSKLVDPVATRAQELQLPLVTLTQKESTAGEYVFNLALTPTMQVKELLRYAIEKVGAKRFAIMAPASKFGEEYVRAFWDEIDRESKHITAIETYPSDETDFRDFVDKLVGLNQTDARAREVEELKLLKSTAPVKYSSKRMNRMFTLKPIIDFDAVFIPDDPKVLGQLLPTFAYRDIDKMLFLGINTWNSTELIARAGHFAEGAIFVDAYYQDSQNPQLKKFIEEYRETFQSEPSSLEAISYDAGHILAVILANDSVSSRNDMKNRIMGLKNFPGIMGSVSYNAGRLTKRLAILTIKDGKIEEIAEQ